MKYDFLIIGAGFAGSVMAERIASQLNKKVLIVEKRDHIGGNSYDEYDESGILVHKYGPHIFHTNSKEVFEYLSQFTEWRFYEHKVLASFNGDLYPIPINRITINKLYNTNFDCDEHVKSYYEKVRENRYPIENSEDIIVNQVGHDLFNKFFRAYTKKQWHLEPKDLSASVCGRIPVRVNEDSRYFDDIYQYMPSDGYTKMFQKMLHSRNIDIALGTDYKKILNDVKFDKLIYTGPIDSFFDYQFGKLPYRSLRFEYESFECESYQQAAQINYVSEDVAFTRIIEHKKLSGQTGKFTTISKEYSQKAGEPFYPVPTQENRNLYSKYKKESDKLNCVTFCGRLAEYQYYNMDQVIIRSLKLSENLQS